MKKVFALVDCNNFFVSCERLFNPQARNKPAVVFSNNDGCVIARSNEAKQIGIKMAEPVFECKELMDFFNVRGFSTNFSLYSDLSERISTILRSFSNEIEVYSVDESFLELTHLQIDDYEEFGRRIKDEVYRLIGIPVSVGIAPTKTLAKVCSKLAKKNSGVFVFPENCEDVLKKFPVSDVWGIGWASSKKLKKIGVTTVYDFVNLESKWILKNFGVLGLKTWWELKGESAISLNASKEIPKSMAHTRTFKSPISDINILKARLYDFACEISTTLRSQNLVCGEIYVYLRGSKYSGGGGKFSSLKLSQYTNLRTELCFAIEKLLPSIIENGKSYKKGGVVVGKIIKEVDMNRLFSSKSISKENAERAVDFINTKWKGIVHLGSQSYEKYQKSQFKSGEFTTNWRELCSVF